MHYYYPHFFRQRTPDPAYSGPALLIFVRFRMFIPLTQGMSPIETRLFINNEYVYSRAQMSIAVCNPTDGSTITADLQVAGGEDINAVVAAATSAFRTGPWDYAGHADKIAGEPYPPEDGIYKIVTYEPLGVCAFLASFKATFLTLGLRKIPFGRTCTRSTSLRGWFPPGVISLVSGGVETGALPASHMDIAHINFTGSVAADRRVQEPAGKSNLKDCILELGGLCCLFEEAQIRFGDPMSFSTLFGPLADKSQMDRVLGYIECGKKESDLIYGVFDRPKASIYTEDLSRALRVSARLRTGTVGINKSVSPEVETPFGGVTLVVQDVGQEEWVYGIS
ncbi:aldehyde dehydrogenase, putative [Aspergillus fumigatus Z5]|nr:aldehyde dehydrogenase, putative [Aspergillus fumigatus Z5]